jgi:mono/diheme cytochrome c family protein
MVALACVLLAGCVTPSRQSTTAENAVTSAQPSAAATPTQAPQNGQVIFQTGRDVQGTFIASQPTPLMRSCAACHRANGSGGLHLPGGAVSADLRHRALVTQQTPPYTLALIERAISQGIDNTGQPLSPVMPRWRLSKRDLHDVAQYVLTKLK